MFYVYEHIRLDTDTILYVGKWCGGRVRSKDKRSKHWNAIVDKAATEAAVVSQIEAKKNPVQSSGLPWGN